MACIVAYLVCLGTTTKAIQLVGILLAHASHYICGPKMKVKDILLSDPNFFH